MSQPENTPASSTLTTDEGSPVWTSYFSSKEWVAYAAIIVLGLIFRWVLLDMRPYHHDESLHGMYGRYFYDWPNNNFYKYDPMLHGPMLYNCMRFIYAMFGDSLWAARTPVAIMGSLFMFVPFLFRTFFKRQTVLLLTAAVALSPTLVYWSRFLREDFWVVSGMLISVYGITLAPARLRALLFMLGATIQWCTKENIFVTLAIVVGYLVVEAVYTAVEKESMPRPLSLRALDYVARHPWETTWAFVACLLIYSWFFSAGFRYPDGIIDGLGYKGFQYWMEHHGKERIEGPFNFHLYVLGWYEFPFLVAFFAHMAMFYRRASKEILFVAAAAAVVILFSLGLTDLSNPREFSVWRFLKLKDGKDLFGALLLLFHAPLVTFQHLMRGERRLAITGYLFTASFFVYSYLGEKVPWLSIYPLIFGLPYLALFFEDHFTKYPFDYKRFRLSHAFMVVGCILMGLGILFTMETLIVERPANPFSEPTIKENMGFLGVGVLVAMCGLLSLWEEYLGRFNVGLAVCLLAIGFNIRATVQTNFLYAGKETEYLSQVHTTYELAEAAKNIIDTTLNEKNNYRPKILVNGEATWPLTWYFRHLREEYKFSATRDEWKDFTYIFDDWKEPSTGEAAPEGFYVRKLNLRGWWVPDFKLMTVKKSLAYAVNHYPWGPSGFSYTTLLVNKNTERFK
jgi:uncharacterized protein (TIGR03663 family)